MSFCTCAMTSAYTTYFDQCPRAFFYVRNVRAQTDLFAEAVEEVDGIVGATEKMACRSRRWERIDEDGK